MPLIILLEVQNNYVLLLAKPRLPALTRDASSPALIFGRFAFLFAQTYIIASKVRVKLIGANTLATRDPKFALTALFRHLNKFKLYKWGIIPKKITGPTFHIHAITEIY